MFAIVAEPSTAALRVVLLMGIHQIFVCTDSCFGMICGLYVCKRTAGIQDVFLEKGNVIQKSKTQTADA